MNASALNLNRFLDLNPPAERGEIKKKITIKIKTVLMTALWLVSSATLLRAQVPAPAPQPDPLMQLMLTQPPIDISTNITVTASFDPPVIAVGDTATYRVTVNAVNDSVRWPEDVLTPAELTLRFSARGQILQPAGDKIRPATTVNHRVTVTKTGTFIIPEFKLRVYGKPVTVPAAQLQVLPQAPANLPPPLRLYLQLSETNAFCGQPVKVLILMPSVSGNVIQSLSSVQLNGDGILLDQSAVRQRIRQMEFQGRTGPVYMYESTVTPLVAGRLDITAQGFTAGNQFSGGIVIQGNVTIPGGQPQYVLLDSDPVSLEVEPLPRAGVLPGFTGAIGKFSGQPPRLSADVVRVGEMVKVFATFESDGETKRLLAPAPPAVTNWQMFPPLAEGPPVMTPVERGGFSAAVTFSYTMIPLTNSMTATPAIPFSYFDPELKKYVDLTIPSLPLTVRSGLATAEAQAIAQAAAASRSSDKKLKLSDLAPAPGRTTGTLIPLQQRSFFWWLQLLPLTGFGLLWYAERRRRFLEQHPDVVRRRQARRTLRGHRKEMRAAAIGNDEVRFARSAVLALQTACAPHFPALPRALVGRDILAVFDESTRDGRTGEVVRKLFATTDAAQFSTVAAPRAGELLALQPELEQLLDILEAKL
jgi:hypothetical protein